MDIHDTPHVDSTTHGKDRFFDAWRVPRSAGMHQLVADVLQMIDAYEEQNHTRKRRRKADDQRVFDLTVSAILCDLAHVVLTEDKRGTAISRSNRELGKTGRYTPPASNRQIPYVLDLLNRPDLGWLSQELGEERAFGRNQRTLMRPTERMTEAIAKYDINFNSLRRSPTAEVIILKSGKSEYWDQSKDVAYEDTPETIAYRHEMRAINEFLDEVDIDFDDAFRTGNTLVDTHARTLRRYFTRSFDSGGRLFGGFWQNLRKQERLNGLLINGEPVMGLDYGQIATRILYGIAGATPPPGDLYDIPGLTRLNGGNYRDGVKTIMSSLMFTDDQPKRKPKGSKPKLPPNLSIQEIVELIKSSHPRIAHLLGTDVGHSTQFIESRIITKVINQLMSEGIVALPIHDRLIIETNNEAITEEVMRSVFKNEVGLDCPVSREISVERTSYMALTDWGTSEKLPYKGCYPSPL